MEKSKQNFPQEEIYIRKRKEEPEKKQKSLFPFVKYEDFLKAIERFKRLKLLVIGDVGLDEYVFGDVHRVSPEAPVPVLDVRERKFSLGLAANVAENILSLGGQVKLVGVMGEDESSILLKRLLKESHFPMDSLFVDKTRKTTRKTRLIAQKQHIVRLDDESQSPISASLEKEILNKICDCISDFDGVILEDYAKGSLSEGLMKEVIRLSHVSQKRVIVDPHLNTPLSHYLGADVLKPNFKEALVLTQLQEEYKQEKRNSLQGVRFSFFEKEKREKDLEEEKSTKASKTSLEHSFCEKAGEILRKRGFPFVIVTQGKEGMNFFSKEESSFVPSSFPRSIFDVTGAGDTALATLSLSWFSGLSLKESCFLANLASSLVVKKIGAVSCSEKELKETLALALPKAFESSSLESQLCRNTLEP